MAKGKGRAIDQSSMPVGASQAGAVYASQGSIVSTIPVGYDGKPLTK